jgi:hypothetical protein
MLGGSRLEGPNPHPQKSISQSPPPSGSNLKSLPRVALDPYDQVPFGLEIAEKSRATENEGEVFWTGDAFWAVAGGKNTATPNNNSINLFIKRSLSEIILCNAAF